MPSSNGRTLFSLLVFFVFLLSGCMGASSGGGSGLGSKSSATVTLIASSASVAAGNGVTLEAYVNPVLATGTVTFYDGSNGIGSATITSNGVVATTGIALLTTTFSSVGTHSITAHYNGNDFYSPTVSSAIAIGVYNDQLASSSVTLQASTTTPEYQTSVTLTATVSPSAATGTVTFYNGSTNLGSAPVSAGTASLITSFAAGGTATLHAVYSGDYNYLSSSSNSLTMNISGPQVTSISLRASTNSTAVGDSVTLTANIVPATATGTVTFYNGSASIGTANVSAGAATLTTTFSASGHLTLQAVLAANASWESSTSNLIPIFVTGNTPDTVVLQVAPSSVVIGYSATLTATVSPAAATGNVTFYDGSAALGTVGLSAGTATFTNTFMSAGTQSLTAVYTGDTTYVSTTSSAVNFQVSNPGPTPSTTTLALSESSGYTGDTVTLTATVAPSAATGQVNFYDNGSLLGNAVLSAGTAAWSQVFNQAGDNEITAVYQGDVTYSSSTSNAQDLQLSDQSGQSPTCPADPIDCQIECPGNPICNIYCPSDPTLCAEECPGYAGCPPDTSGSSLELKSRIDRNGVFGPLRFKRPVLECVAPTKKGS